jgi:hypothetical protein
MAVETRCVWLYAVAAHGALTAGAARAFSADGPFEVADAEGALAVGAVGVGGGPVRTVSAGGLTAVVEDVDEREFGAAALRRNLEDLEWLDLTARAHHAVIDAAAERGPVVPMRLATVYSCAEKVAGMLRRRAADLHSALARITARSEWGVKAFAAEPAAAKPAAAKPFAAEPGATGPDGKEPEAEAPAPHEQGNPAPGSTGPGPGAAYLQRRRAQLMARRSGHEQAMISARRIHAELERLSVSVRLYPPQSPDLAGRQARMVLNAAYLVDDERADEFAAAVAGLTVGHPPVRLVLTGPWPAYSFAGEPETAEQP